MLGPPPYFTLPAPTTRLLGREEELARALALLTGTDVRMLTLTGPAGVGKTRLALEVAAGCRAAFGNAVVFVPLASLSDPALMADTIVRACGIHERGDQPLATTLAARLHDAQLLLVLDNFEHLLPAAPLVADLLGACPGLKLLVTSRSILRLRGEWTLAVPPLPLPETTAMPSLQSVALTPAVALFVERAQAISSNFALTPAVAAEVAAICRRLDGLPLAIELAAARSQLLLPRVLLAKLEQRLPTLVGGARDLPERQRTLRAALAWSYDLLLPAEQALFRRLGIFVGGASLEAIEAVCQVSNDRSPAGLEWLAALVDHSLVRQEPSATGEPRVTMLETMREYALEQVIAHAEDEALYQRYATYFQTMAEQAEIALQGAEQEAWLTRLEHDHDNLRAVLHWAQEHGELEIGLRLAGALWFFWYICGYLNEGRRWLEGLLASAQADGSSVSPTVRAKAFSGASWLAHSQNDEVRATELAQEAIALSSEAGSERARAFALTTLAMVAMNRGDFADAMATQQEAIALFRAMDDAWAIAGCLNNLGLLAGMQGDYTQARTLLEESVILERRREDRRDTAMVLNNLAAFAFAQGDHARAQMLWRESLMLGQTVGGALRDEVVFESVEGLAEIAAAKGHTRNALQLLAAAEELRSTVGLPRPPHRRDAYDSVLWATREATSREVFESARAEGAALSLAQAVAAALAVTSLNQASCVDPPQFDGG